MKRVIIIIVCLLSASLADITDYLSFNGNGKHFVAECYNSSKLDEVSYEEAVTCRDMADARVQEFLYCFFVKNNFLDAADNRFNTAVFRPAMSNSNYKVLVRCGKTARLGGGNVFQQVGGFFECFVKKYVPDKCSKRRNKLEIHN